MEKLRISKLYPNAKLPTRKYYTDAGIDLYAYTDRVGTVLAPHSVSVIGTGITVEIPPDCVGLLWAKSGSKFMVGAGVIDQGYQGEILVKVINPTRGFIPINNEDPIAQLLIMPIKILDIEETHLHEIHQEKSERGESRGIKE